MVKVKDQERHPGVKKAATVAQMHLNARKRLYNNKIPATSLDGVRRLQ